MPRYDISYDFEDFGMTEAELKAKYPNGHPEYTPEQWRGRPQDELHSADYWQWVTTQIRKDDDAMPSVLDDQPDTVEVADLDQFVRALTHWHTNKVAQLRHLLSVPQGTPVEIDGTQHVLSGDLHTGFTAGITIALSLIGELPFVAEVESESADGESGHVA